MLISESHGASESAIISIVGPLVDVPVDGLFFKESFTRLSGKNLLFEPYLDH